MANVCFNVITIEGDDDELVAFSTRWKNELAEKFPVYWNYEWDHDSPDELKSIPWDEWRKGVPFATRWGPAYETLYENSAMFPGLTFTNIYYGADDGNAGETVIKNGLRQSHSFYEYGTVEFFRIRRDYFGDRTTIIRLESIADLQKIGRDPDYELDGSYELMCDLDASETASWNGGTGLKPIGSEGRPFMGIFDGCGYKITGLVINRRRTDDVGLFGVVGPGSVVKNVGLEGCTIAGRSTVGGIVGKNEGGRVERCYVTSTVTGNYSVGGIVGHNGGSGVLSECFAAGAIEGNEDAGGLVGGNDESATVLSSYWDAHTTGQKESAGSEPSCGKTTVGMKSKANYEAWDFDSAWGLDEHINEGYPYLLSPPDIKNAGSKENNDRES